MIKIVSKKLALFNLVIGFLALACNNEDYPVYDITQQDGVYIAYEKDELTTDSIHYEYGFALSTEITIKVPVKLMGMPVSNERKFAVEIIDPLTTMSEGIHYSIDQSHLAIPSNKLEGSIDITFYRDKDPLLTDTTYILSFQLVRTDDLNPVQGQSSFQITYSDKRPQTPVWWRTWNLGTYNFEVAQWFFHYFYLTEEINPQVFNELIERYGDYFVEAGTTQGPLDMYGNFFAKYVLQPLYEQYLDDPNINIPKPGIY